jgi:hypothetical protein
MSQKRGLAAPLRSVVLVLRLPDRNHPQEVPRTTSFAGAQGPGVASGLAKVASAGTGPPRFDVHTAFRDASESAGRKVVSVRFGPRAPREGALKGLISRSRKPGRG